MVACTTIFGLMGQKKPLNSQTTLLMSILVNPLDHTHRELSLKTISKVELRKSSKSQIILLWIHALIELISTKPHRNLKLNRPTLKTKRDFKKNLIGSWLPQAILAFLICQNFLDSRSLQAVFYTLTISVILLNLKTKMCLWLARATQPRTFALSFSNLVAKALPILTGPPRWITIGLKIWRRFLFWKKWTAKPQSSKMVPEPKTSMPSSFAPATCTTFHSWMTISSYLRTTSCTLTTSGKASFLKTTPRFTTLACKIITSHSTCLMFRPGFREMSSSAKLKFHRGKIEKLTRNCGLLTLKLGWQGLRTSISKWSTSRIWWRIQTIRRSTLREWQSCWTNIVTRLK